MLVAKPGQSPGFVFISARGGLPADKSVELKVQCGIVWLRHCWPRVLRRAQLCFGELG